MSNFFNASPPPTALPMLKGAAPDIVSSNTSGLKSLGNSEFSATTKAIRMAKPRKSNPNAHKNLGKFLHPKKAR